MTAKARQTRKRARKAPALPEQENNDNAWLAEANCVVSAMEADFNADTKGFYIDRDGNKRAQAMISAIIALEQRLQKFVRAN
jgi:hypothetical protein